MHNKGEFIHRLQADTQVIDRDEAEKIVSVVFTTLHHRLTPDQADHVEAHLPKDMKDLWSGNILQRAVRRIASPEKMDYTEFMDRIAEETGLPRDRAEALTRAVFRLLKEQLGKEEAHDVQAELPKRLQIAWLEA